MITENQDIEYLEHSIELADEAVSEGNHPFGAVLVDTNGNVLAVGKNSYSVDRGPGHAETNLAREAARSFAIETLRGATLYTWFNLVRCVQERFTGLRSVPLYLE